MFIQTKKFILSIGLLTVALLIAGLIVGFYSLRYMKEIVSEQFNQQQLELATHAGRQLENQFLNMIQDVTILNQSPSVQYLEKVSWANRIKITLSTLQETGVLEIGRVDGSGKKCFAVTSKEEVRIVPGPYASQEPFLWSKKPEHKNRISLVPANLKNGTTGRPIMKIIIPTYLESVDDAHPVALHRYAGYIYLLLDTRYFVAEMLKEIRSGKTGYAWAIDNDGNFIYHPVPEFIGKNAFEVRGQREAKISFDQINRIQKEKMLRGVQGTSSYVSGWHRGMRGNINKLIAYAPVRLRGTSPSITWAVAVVAPATEVDEVIHAAYLWQFIMQGFIIFAIILGSLSIIGYEWQYAKTLKSEVERKTKDLQRSEEQYKKLVEGAQDIIFSADRQGRFLSLNRYGANFLRGELFDPETQESLKTRHYVDHTGKFIGKELAEFFPPNGFFHPQLIEEIWRTGRPKTIEHTFKIRANDYWLSTQLIAIKDDQGLVQEVLGISRDITEKKKIEKQMINTEKLASLGLLAAGVAHEINNPLGVILGYCDYMLDKIPPEDKVHKVLEKIERQGNHCKKVVENLLSFSRYTEHSDTISDINLNLGNVFSVVENNLMIKKIQLKKNLEANLPRVKADPVQLQQVFLNLITNAVAAMPKGGTLTVITRWNIYADKVEVVITDTGTGIRKEHREKIYDPFFTTKKVGEGTGLGLTVTYGIIDHYQGLIQLETKTEEEDPVNHGTSFTVILPVYHSKREAEKKGA
ncbi:MAG: PAS domain-containing protein [Deltaproteobacteria bacterium]|nr:PAS domain-containing protein [Deltaproteobacteria bacterium]